METPPTTPSKPGFHADAGPGSPPPSGIPLAGVYVTPPIKSVLPWRSNPEAHAAAMRFLLRAAALLILVSGSVAILFAAQYSSMSPQELQRRLERDTSQLIDSLRYQRNSPSRSSGYNSGPDPWIEGMRAREARDRENRAEQARLDAEWRRDHPNETRQQYFARIDRETAERAREERRQRDAAAYARRAQREREAAEQARQKAADWARVRASHHGYAAEIGPPIYSSPAESLQWNLRHYNETHNEWAANQAAMLLMEGIGAPQDIPRALRLLDPNGPAAKKAGTRHPETRALFAYLQLTQPDTVKAAGFVVDPVTARQELDAAASKTDLAKWYFARVLNSSDSPADQKLALRLITRGAFWARVYFAGVVNIQPSALEPSLNHVRPISLGIVEKQHAHLPALIRELPMAEFEAFPALLPSIAEPFRTQAMTLYIETIAERAVPLTPAQNFNFPAFDYILEQGAETGIDGVDGLAALHRFHLLGIDEIGAFRLLWDQEPDAARTLAALTRWSSRDDVLGTRARLALEGLAIEAASPRDWKPPLLDEVELYQSAAREHARLDRLAFVDTDSPKPLSQLRSEAATAAASARERALAAVARRDAAAPKIPEVPGLLGSLRVSEGWHSQRDQLVLFTAGQPLVAAAFAATDASFDLPKAESLYDAAFAPGTPATQRRHHLFEAMRLGDAFAPAAIATELQQLFGSSPPLETLRQLSAARRARDVAAKNPRALLLHAIDARLREEDFGAPLAEAAAAGSILAQRLIVAHRIDKSMSHDTDRPPSWGLAPELIAELDVSIAAWDTPAFSTEWQFLSNVLSFDDTHVARGWFHPAGIWEADRLVRLADAELVRAVQPQVDAILATLAAWPGIDHQDPRHTELFNDASGFRAAAENLAPTNGLESLRLFLQAAVSGDRSSLEMLADHIRLGLGELPRSYELANALSAAELKMTQADAEAGDSSAAEAMARHFLSNSDAPENVSAGLTWLRYAAELGERTAATALRDRALTPPVDAAAARRWSVVIEAIDSLEHIPGPPRRPPADPAPLAPVRAELENILAAVDQRHADPVPIIAHQGDQFAPLIDEAYQRLKDNPADGLLALGKIAAAGSREAAFTVAAILVTGRHGVETDLALARRAHAMGLKQIQIEAEYGDAFAAYRLGIYSLELPVSAPDPNAAIRWLTYAAELGEPVAAAFLAQLYTDGAPGLSADAKQATRWTAFAKKAASKNFKPRAPLR
jgi:TPR repeat protein